MKSLYISNAGILRSLDKPGVGRWSDIYNLITQNSTLVDRCDVIKMPYNFKLYEPFRMPRDLTGFSLSYEECCNRRAQELIDLSYRIDKPITIFYSGGIDSTLVVVSFMKLLSSDEFKDRVRIALTWDSIQENPNFYQDYIRPMGNIVGSDNLHNMFDGSTIIVGGEHNDQLFGSDIVGQVIRYMPFNELHKPYNREQVVGFLTNHLGGSSANFWYDLLDNHIKQAPCEVTTNYHFWWWLNFSFKWQNVFFRMIFRANINLRPDINQQFIDNFFHHFYSTDYFQKWSMLNHDLKIRNDWRSYKWESKRLIYEFNKDEYYRDNKVKVGSLVRILTQRRIPIGITSDYEFLDTLNPEEFYVPDNSFV